MAELEDRLDNEWQTLLGELEPGASPLTLPASRRMPFGRVALFAQLEEVREEWQALRSAIQTNDSERYVNAAWTLKDLVAHAASWAREFRSEVETVWRGGSFDYSIPYVMTVIGPNQWNEEQVRAREAQSLESCFDELEAETVRLQDLLLEMSEPDLYRLAEFPFAPSGEPAETWKAPSAAIIAGKCEHDRHHIAQLKERLASWHQR